MFDVGTWRVSENLTGSAVPSEEREARTRLAGVRPQPSPWMDKGVWALAIIRTVEPIHRVSPCGTKQTKWPRSGSPSIPFSFYEPLLPSLFFLPPVLAVSPFYLDGITMTGKRRVTRFSKVLSRLFRVSRQYSPCISFESVAISIHAPRSIIVAAFPAFRISMYPRNIYWMITFHR